jgi:hypothetical protein
MKEPPIDFEMTYPCYMALRPNGVPHTCNADGDNCVAVFTDDDMVDRFFASMNARGQLGRVTIQNSEALRALLSQCNDAETPEGRVVTHVIIDPTEGAKSRTHSIVAFVRYLQWRERFPDGFLVVFPVYTYVIEPGPRPGFFGDIAKGVNVVPLWTDYDNCERYMRHIRSGRIGSAKMKGAKELAAYLQAMPAEIEDVMIDPTPEPPFTGFGLSIAQLISELADA